MNKLIGEGEEEETDLGIGVLGAEVEAETDLGIGVVS